MRRSKGSQEILGTEADDELIGTRKGDTMRGLGGDDVLVGGPGGDRLFGGDGDDLLFAADPVDGSLDRGRRLANVLDGEAGDDELVGGAARDLLLGGEGDDLLAGLGGDDVLLGEAGRDGFVYTLAAPEDAPVEGGRDLVLDFDPEEDVVSLLLELPTDSVTVEDLLALLDGNGDGVLTLGDGPVDQVEVEGEVSLRLDLGGLVQEAVLGVPPDVVSGHTLVLAGRTELDLGSLVIEIVS